MENANASLKQFLRAYVNYNQDNWVDWLLIAEFEVNSDKSVFTGIALFLLTKGYIPRSGMEPPTPWDNSISQRARRKVQSADGFIDKMDRLREHVRQQLEWSRALQKE